MASSSSSVTASPVAASSSVATSSPSAGNAAAAAPAVPIAFSNTSLPQVRPLSQPDEKSSIFFLCDIQETFRNRVPRMPQLIAASQFVTKVARTLAIPVIVTEQHPFLKTVTEIDLTGLEVIRKSKFSMLVDPVIAELKAKPQIRNVFLYGLETHVCVLQTALDLLRGGYNVYLIGDAIGSQNTTDREVALARLAALGCTMTTAESAVYEIMRDAKHPRFKDVLGLVKDYANAKSRL